MSTPFFRFRQFTVRHDRCAMKVNTDGVLLGAWAHCSEALPYPADSPIPPVSDILDIGTGCGLIALMLAQRFPDAHVHAIDIDHNAVMQARDNFAQSPWHNRLKVQHIPFSDFADNHSTRFSLIVSNPPFFTNALPNPDKARRTARHTDTLSFRQIIQYAPTMLQPYGRLALILPADNLQEALNCAHNNSNHNADNSQDHSSLVLTHLTCVHPLPDKPCHRILIEWTLLPSHINPQTDTLILSTATSPRSNDYIALTKDFYL